MLMEHGLRDGRLAEGLCFTQFLTPDGVLAKPLDGRMDESLLLDMYRNMAIARQFDRKAVNLQRQGRLGTYAPFEGQEAAQIGSALALAKDDWMFPTYRDHAATITRGQSMTTVFLYWAGRLEGGTGAKSLRILPPSVPIATHLLHAVGMAWATKLRNENVVTVGYFGDGASSEGDFHEALNFAGLYHLPIIFICQNNGYAISVPFSKQSASKTISQRANAYDIEGERVDGNDVLAVFDAVSRARERARAGGGPTLIEAVTFRYGAHTTADDPKRYRDQELATDWRTHRDPIGRLKRFLEQRGLWTDDFESEVMADATARIELALDEFARYEAPNPLDMFEHVYAEMPWHLKEQAAEFERAMEKDGMQP
ncbi:pyruvate dehydrogenase (acetyl-transferring) E1 component subunit alpha [Alicyclobacillus fastidiosus]|uniref:Pyruvate dehydrogenase E1 component subunit alpha n=1 Tax=Alicyclobacillus fastidiosus TaxID=392011 RepID=A0ABY6Z9Z8_9BACL|nr:pyruvate dehydrogenase (acetyl-transferring) E1 component subunit alpha [Alicyclobacillus fastidiosus]WAH39705.1 pyruvate dehydrogenase (acetyl-transferring) E1 component subunit alpha [Alicyclobacillus fastidiosus]